MAQETQTTEAAAAAATDGGAAWAECRADLTNLSRPDLPEAYDAEKDLPSSRVCEKAAGWYPDRDPWTQNWRRHRQASWIGLLRRRRDPKWDAFSWLTVKTLLESANDQIAKALPAIVRSRRMRWIAGQRAAGAHRADPRPDGLRCGGWQDDFVIDWRDARYRRFLIVGDPGEADASQYAVVKPLMDVHRRKPAWSNAEDDGRGGDDADDDDGGRSDFLVVLSDVIYPAGDVNDYRNAFYLPFDEYARPIYALPGNHDWYDGLNGFMFHFCSAEALPSEKFKPGSYRPGELTARVFWQGAPAPKRDLLAPLMRKRRAQNDWPDSSETNGRRGPCGDPRRDEQYPEFGPPGHPVQPAPYFAIDLGSVLLVAIDTGISGELDAEQGQWLQRVSARPQPKVLLTGKPIYDGNEYHPCPIVWGEDAEEQKREIGGAERPLTVDDIVREESNCYVAAIGGDTHNYQRYRVEVNGRTIQYIVSGGGGAYLSATHMIPTVGPVGEQKLPPEDEISFDEDGFRCYPLRGDSLALFCRRIGPVLFKTVLSALVILAAAVGIIGWGIDFEHAEQRSAVLATTGGVLLAIVALLGVGAGGAWVNRRAPRHAGYVGFFVAGALAMMAGLAAAALVAIDDPDVTRAVVVTAAALPVAILGVLLTYLSRGSMPRVTPNLVLAIPLVALLYAWVAPVDWDPAVAVLFYVVLALALLQGAAALVGVFRALRRVSESTRAYVYRTATFLAWLGLAFTLLHRFGESGGDRTLWQEWGFHCLAAAIVAGLVVGLVIPRSTPSRRQVVQKRWDGVGPAAGPVAGLSLSVVGLVALEHWVADWLPEVMVAAATALFGVVAIGLLAAVLGYARAWTPSRFFQLRTGEITPAAAAQYVADKIGGGSPVRGGDTTADDRKKRAMAEVVRRLGKRVSELADTNEPPFYKNFLSCEIEGQMLVIRCWGVTGYDDKHLSPSLEDCVRIPLTPAPAHTDTPLDSAHSHWELWGTWRRGPDLVADVARRVQEAVGAQKVDISVHLRDDAERFESADEFTKNVTGQALKHFDVIRIDATHSDIHVRVSFVRRPSRVPVGVKHPRAHRVRRGVILEVTSADAASGDLVREIKTGVAATIERGRPRWVTRPSRSGHAERAKPRADDPEDRGASASRALEAELRRWPKKSGFPAIFTACALLLYAGVVALFAMASFGADLDLDLDDGGVRVVVLVGGVIVAVAAYFVQRWLFPAVEVATQTNLRRATRFALSSVTLSSLVGALTSVAPEVADFLAKLF